ncbi:MAG: hypothetical protein JWO86_1436 [Myxococcaceae bacterium]|jgi:hypothetical protein|nr:hypothetical protein [Myxococcaceae bacterium]
MMSLAKARSFLVRAALLGVGLRLVACGGSGDAAVVIADGGSEDARQRPAPDSGDDTAFVPDAARDTGSYDAAATSSDEWSEAGTCNTLISTAPFLPVVPVAQPLPAMTGGNVDPGTYELTKIELFMGADGDAGPPTDSRSQTWRIGPAVDAGLALEVAGASRDVNGNVGRGRTSGSLVPAIGPPFLARLTRSCPAPAVATDVGYSASGTGPGALFAYTFGSYPILYTFTKR